MQHAPHKRVASLSGLLLVTGTAALLSAMPAASGATSAKSARVATRFAGKLANGTPLSLVVKVKAGKIVAITSLVTNLKGFGASWGQTKFKNQQPVKVSHDSFNNTQHALLICECGGYDYLLTIKGKFSRSDTQAKGSLVIADVFPPGTGVHQTSTQSWSAKAKG